MGWRKKVVTGVVAGGLLASVMGASSPGAAAEPQIQAAVRGALNDIMDAGTFKVAGWSNGPLDQASVSNMHAILHDRLGHFLTGAALDSYRATLDETIDRESDGNHVVVTAGGADQFEWSEILVDGDHASVAAHARTWITWVIKKADVPGPRSGHPIEWDRVIADLELVDGTWLVNHLEFQPETN